MLFPQGKLLAESSPCKRNVHVIPDLSAGHWFNRLYFCHTSVLITLLNRLPVFFNTDKPWLTPTMLFQPTFIQYIHGVLHHIRITTQHHMALVINTPTST